MTRRNKRLAIVVVLVLGVGAAAAMVLGALKQNMSLFFSPTEVLAGSAPVEHTFRIGGLVEEGSVVRSGEDLTVRFALTDGGGVVPVTFTGILPDLFREGQGIVARGRMQADGVFVAEEVLAKHDENYMPPEVADALIKQGGANGLPNPHSNSAR